MQLENGTHTGVQPTRTLRIVTLSTLLLFGLPTTTAVWAQSRAHDESAFAIIDPTYSAEVRIPAPVLREDGETWIYGAGELESWRLQLWLDRVEEAELQVGYPGQIHEPYSEASYRLFLEEALTLDSLAFRAVGSGTIFLNGEQAATFDASDELQRVSLTGFPPFIEIRFEMISDVHPPALLIENPSLSTSSENWQWRSGVMSWEPAYHFEQTVSGIPPHLIDNPTFVVEGEPSTNSVYDFGRTIFGHVRINSDSQPTMIVGESRTEALDLENDNLEQSLAVEEVGDGLWQSVVPLAFRYVYATSETGVEHVESPAWFYPTYYKGAFAASDPRLTEIWMNSAYTLRYNMHDFLMDGMKRDRLPWAGDVTMSIFVNAFTFREPEIVRRTLVALNNNGIAQSDINGIVDYSMAWVLAQDMYQLYFDDQAHLEREWPRIKDTLLILQSRTDEEGFIDPQDNWVFIDWVDEEKWTALQIYFWWAQQSGINLAERVGDTQTAELLRAWSSTLATNLEEVAWSQADNAWLSGRTADSIVTRHPNFLAIVSGLSEGDQADGASAALSNPDVPVVGTPYMAGFENLALGEANEIDPMIGNISQYWGAMLDEGATTFWEAYNSEEQGAEQYAFYDRPYAKSLGHAWSAGPAYIFPTQIFGLRPVEDGWQRFELDVQLGDLEWASVSVPTPYGNIIVDADQNSITATVPAGTVAEWRGASIEGPATVTDDY